MPLFDNNFVIPKLQQHVDSSSDVNPVNQQKKLADIILERIVLSFFDVFFEKVSDSRRYSPKNIFLPSEVFENILYKSREMKVEIPFHYLKSCLPRIKFLQWININFTYGERYTESVLNGDDLKIICDNSSEIRSLRFFASGLKRRSLNYLSQMRGLEILEIDNLYSFLQSDPREIPIGPPVKISLKYLKKLKIHCTAIDKEFFSSLDMEISFKSLETLEIESSCFGNDSEITLLQSIALFTNLRNLSLKGLNLSQTCCEKIFQDLNNLKNLKSLDFSKCWLNLRGNEVICNLLRNVISIENLFVGQSLYIPNGDSNLVPVGEISQSMLDSISIRAERKFVKVGYCRYTRHDKDHIIWKVFQRL